MIKLLQIDVDTIIACTFLVSAVQALVKMSEILEKGKILGFRKTSAASGMPQFFSMKDFQITPNLGVTYYRAAFTIKCEASTIFLLADYHFWHCMQEIHVCPFSVNADSGSIPPRHLQRIKQQKRT